MFRVAKIFNKHLMFRAV